MNVRSSTRVRKWIFRSLVVLAVLVVGTLGWARWVYAQIQHYAGQDHAAPATTSDHHRPAPQLREAAQLDAGEERVHVRVQDVASSVVAR